MTMITLFMTLLFLTSIVSLSIYRRTKQEIHLVLAIFTAIILVIWGFAVAHWSIHILALFVLLWVRIPIFTPKTIKISQE